MTSSAKLNPFNPLAKLAAVLNAEPGEARRRVVTEIMQRDGAATAAIYAGLSAFARQAPAEAATLLEGPTAPKEPIENVSPMKAAELFVQQTQAAAIKNAYVYRAPSLAETKLHVQGGPQYLHTVDGIYKEMRDLAAAHPDLVKLETVGQSWRRSVGEGGDDILAMHLSFTGPGAASDKPIALYIAGVHAREVANPEALVRWAKETVSAYGQDPIATAILNSTEIVIVPMVNPDGHRVIERAYAAGGAMGSASGSHGMMQRKNDHPFPDSNGYPGVDLNRNFDAFWADGKGTEKAKEIIYRGPAPASEPETQAIQNLLQKLKPNVFLDVHSYSELILYPWDYATIPAPDHENLARVAKRLATETGYTAMQGSKLYPASGTSIDYAYFKLGIPSFTAETGKKFHQTQKDFEKTYTAMRPVFDLLPRVLRDVYGQIQGPDIQNVRVAEGQVTATATCSISHCEQVAGAEVVLNPAVPTGEGHALSASDGAYDSATEKVSGALPTKASASEVFYIRGIDNQGHAGPWQAQFPGGQAA